eukprot:TRINITY_DN4574_c0_g2_i1.p1 TRINITY_DN4574_c0_g2~~TRINITY_DN4574_c0_g2_i1.p1  ORF type:complete len:150 (+),score=6.98 TRINITY_DN4574_c0_g2_i1:140-589(+)
MVEVGAPIWREGKREQKDGTQGKNERGKKGPLRINKRTKKECKKASKDGRKEARKRKGRKEEKKEASKEAKKSKRKEGRKEGRKDGRKEERKKGQGRKGHGKATARQGRPYEPSQSITRSIAMSCMWQREVQWIIPGHLDESQGYGLTH